MTKFLTLLVLASILLIESGCSSESSELEKVCYDTRGVATENNIPSMDKDSAIVRFARILSRAVSERQDVRSFLKNEAGRRFDANTDILYGEAKEKTVGTASFREILTAYSSSAEMSVIERSVPRLNIFIPEIPLFDVTIDNMDCSDTEIPVVVEGEKGMSLYVNGNLDLCIPKGELPDFHTIVINENNRIEVNTNSDNTYRGYKTRAYNIGSERNTRSIECSMSQLSMPDLRAYYIFQGNNGGKDSKALQRDYIYYGLTPEKSDRGTLNQAVSEYIAFIEVDPNSYFTMSDQIGDELYNDPHIVKGSVSRKKQDFTEEELINEMWSTGTYSFRFEVSTLSSSRPTVSIINLRPDQLWDFNYNREYQHSTLFRHSKYTYTIDPKKFTRKRVELGQYDISFGKWDLSQEALEKYVTISEVDKSKEYEKTVTYDMTTLNSSKVSGGIKFGLGTDISGNASTEYNASTTKRTTKTFTMRRSEEDDELGTIKVYFYDPVVVGTHRYSDKPRDFTYCLKTYNTGIISFALLAK